MPDHAGFALAVTVRNQMLNDKLRTDYAAGRIGHSFNKSFEEIPFPRGSVTLFFQTPQLTLSKNDREHCLMRVTGWGTISIRVNPFPSVSETRNIQFEAEFRVRHQASLKPTSITVRIEAVDYELVSFQFDVLSGTLFSAEADAYLNGDRFTELFTAWISQAIGNFVFPIDLSFLGRIEGAEFVEVTTVSVTDALMLGLDIPLGEYQTSGDPASLSDFAAGNDIALYINRDVVPLVLQRAEQTVRDEIAKQGATLDGDLVITTEEGRFRVRGRATKSDGAANFSFAVVPQMFHTRPGAIFPMKKMTMVVKARTWPALSFATTEPSVDIDRPAWVIVLEIIGGIFTVGVIPAIVESIISGIASSIAGGITSANVNPNGPIPRVRRRGDPATRIKIEAFDIHPDGVFAGITSRLEIKPPLLSGLKSIPRNFANRNIRYDIRLPFGALHDDPFLRVRWTVIDMESGSVLANEDDVALNRLSFQFTPASFGVQTNRFAVVCRVYRALGPFVTELLNETIRLDVGPPIAPGAFVRWRYDVKNPQIALDAATEKYSYVHDQVVQRWSKFHRTAKPCKMAEEQSRYKYSTEVLDDLPFPIHDISGNRYRLCDYCFFGGPGSSRSSL